MPPLAWQAFQKMHITISADPVDCKQRIRFKFNPSDAVKSSVFAPPPRAPVGPSDARDGLGLTAVAYSTTLSLKKFSVSLRISICGLTNMAMSHTLPQFVRRVRVGGNEKRPICTSRSRLRHRI